MTDTTRHSVAVFASHADHMNTGGKNAWVGRWLQQAGYDVLMLCGDEANAGNFQKLKLPYCKLAVEEKTIDLMRVAAEVDALLTTPITTGTVTPPPTLGRMLAFDDLLGCGRQWVVNGAGAVAFDCLVSTMLPSELTIGEDAILGLQLWRYTTSRKIPHIAIECSPLANDTKLQQWPVDLLLTKCDPRLAAPHPTFFLANTERRDVNDLREMSPGRVIQLEKTSALSWTPETHPHYRDFAPEVYQMDRSCRYAHSLSTEPLLEDLYAHQKTQLMVQLHTFGARFLYLPFHLSYKERVIELLTNLEEYREDLLDNGFALVLSCDSRQHRRMLTEQMMVNEGLLRWLNPWRRDGQKRFAVIEGPPQLWLMDMCQATLAPCESLATEWARQWRIPVILPGEESRLTDLSLGTSVVEAVQHMLDPEREVQEQAA